MHHFNEESLAGCFHELDGRKAVGIDGIDKEDYGRELEANLEDLVARMKRMAYRPGPVRQVLIDKEDNPGEKRPLGISNFEDKNRTEDGAQGACEYLRAFVSGLLLRV
jgi:RNA-directed DNA polymerase